MILDQDRHLAELVQFPGIDFGGFITEVSLRKKQFGRTFDVRANFANLVDLALSASAQQGKNLVLAFRLLLKSDQPAPLALEAIHVVSRWDDRKALRQQIVSTVARSHIDDVTDRS